MKSTTLIKNAAIAILLGCTLFLNSCKKDETNKPGPAISVSSTSASNQAGLGVATTVSISAPEGGKTLTITVNGAPSSALPDVTLDGTTAQDVPVTFTIPEGAVVGGTYLVTFQAIDKKDQLSAYKTFLVTVSEFPNKEIVEVLAGNITTDTHWTADKIYRINGFVRIGSDTHTGAGTNPTINSTAVLTIDAGTVIYGKTGAPGGTLIIQRGSKIMALGTVDHPILFTSEKEPGSRIAGDWGGLVLCGKAKNNTQGSLSTGTDGVEELEGAYGGFHGGTVDDDNSGTLQYVRIEYAGYPINPNQEINGLTMGSVGSGTTIDHVQVSFSNDDSFEWFGGTVSPKNLIAFKGLDDDFDTDNGFSGKVQFGLGIREPNTADQSGSNGFESDNDAGGTAHQPFTDATFSNMTIIGAKENFNTPINVQFQNGAQIRRNSRIDIINSVITAYPNGIYIDNAAAGTIVNAANGDLNLKNNVLAGVENWGGNGFGTAATVEEQTTTGLPFQVPQTAGSATLGNFNHVVAPRGLVVAGGVGSFSSGVFTLGTLTQIGTDNPFAWFKNTNSHVSKWSDASLKIDASIFSPTTPPTLLPGAGSALLTGGSVAGYTGLTDVSYKGAFGATDWTLGWTDWNPQFTDHSK